MNHETMESPLPPQPESGIWEQFRNSKWARPVGVVTLTAAMLVGAGSNENEPAQAIASPVEIERTVYDADAMHTSVAADAHTSATNEFMVIRKSPPNVAKRVGNAIISVSEAGSPKSITLKKAKISEDGVTLSSSHCTETNRWRNYYQKIGRVGGETCDGQKGSVRDPMYSKETFVDKLSDLKNIIAWGVIRFDPTQAGLMDRAWATKKESFMHFTRPETETEPSVKHPIKSILTTDNGLTVIRRYQKAAQ